MGGECSRRGSDDKGIQFFFPEKLKGRYYLEDIGQDERRILEWILKK
jgi:hypothetical protein